MDKDEEKLIRQFGKIESFKVPDGYFEGCTSQLMNKLPEKSHKKGILVLPFNLRFIGSFTTIFHLLLLSFFIFTILPPTT